jgi:hypothetical protein
MSEQERACTRCKAVRGNYRLQTVYLYRLPSTTIRCCSQFATLPAPEGAAARVVEHLLRLPSTIATRSRPRDVTDRPPTDDRPTDR